MGACKARLDWGDCQHGKIYSYRVDSKEYDTVIYIVTINKAGIVMTERNFKKRFEIIREPFTQTA
jgi:hypothetical protein